MVRFIREYLYLYECVRVCLSVKFLKPKRFGKGVNETLKKLSDVLSHINFFLGFWISETYYVMAAIMFFSEKALLWPKIRFEFV